MDYLFHKQTNLSQDLDEVSRFCACSKSLIPGLRTSPFLLIFSNGDISISTDPKQSHYTTKLQVHVCKPVRKYTKLRDGNWNISVRQKDIIGKTLYFESRNFNSKAMSNNNNFNFWRTILFKKKSPPLCYFPSVQESTHIVYQYLYRVPYIW